MAFTPLQKAEIFARDRGTCCFSGKSLWLLDYGASPFWEQDWCDHKKPESRGGSSAIENGVCASYSRNQAKANNGRDTNYLLANGMPTDYFARYVGAVPLHLTQQLLRLANLHFSDWFFNRCIAAIFVGFDNRIAFEDEGISYKRSDAKWFESGWRFLNIYQKLTGDGSVPSMEKRGILLKPLRADTDKSFG